MTATDVRADLDRLVGFDTTSVVRSNADLVGWIAERMDRPGVTIWDLPDDAAPGDEDQHNLLVRIGPDAPGGWILSAHLDCVPVTGQPWSTDPFEVVDVDGRLHGRGTTDMKGFLAACLAGLDDVDPGALRRPIVLALSHSEEVGTHGAPALLAAVTDRLDRPELAIVGEPTMMRVVGAHKGVRAGWVDVHGVDAHSSQTDRGASATVAMARLIAHLDDLARDREQNGPHDDRFHPPYTTFNMGQAHGGQAVNIIPRHARFQFEYRPIPGDDPDQVVRSLQGHAAEVVLPAIGRDVGVDRVAVEVEMTAEVPPLAPEADSAAERLARACGATDEPTGFVAYGTDGGHFQARGIPTIVCGPGSIDQAHQPDEWLDPSQLAAAVAFVRRLAVRATEA